MSDITFAAASRPVFEAEHKDFRESFSRFLTDHVGPHYSRWQSAGQIERAVFGAAAEHGFVAMQGPEEAGGLGIDDIRFRAALAEAAATDGFAAFGLALASHNDLGIGLFAAANPNDARWPGLLDGSVLTTTVLDPVGLSIEADGADVRLDGTLVSVPGGRLADLLILALPTGALAVLETAQLDRADADPLIGMRALDVANFTFDGVTVPADALLTDVAEAVALARREQQISHAALAIGLSRAALRWTIEYVRDRKAFGQPIAAFENSKILLGEATALVDVAEAALDTALAEFAGGSCSPRRCAAVKLAATQALDRAVDAGVQLHGGYGYMLEYPIAHAYADARVLRLIGTPSERLKLTVADAAGV